MTKSGSKVVNSVSKIVGNVLASTEGGRWGGGLALIYHDRYQTKCQEQGATQSSEHGIWQVRSSKTTNVIIAICHPPYSDANPVTNSMFIDDFTDWIGERVMNIWQHYYHRRFQSTC